MVAHSGTGRWIQAHGHAQLSGWVGTFILGIGFYSIPKLRKLKPFALWSAWLTWAQKNPKQLLPCRQAMARSGGMQCQELLTQSKILQNKVPARTQSTEDPAEEMPD